MKNASLILAFALLASGNVFADDQTTAAEGQTKLKVEEAKDSKNKVSGDIDEEITNAKMRAESGSKSKFSLSVNSQYTGGTFSSAFGTKRPALSGEPGQQTFTSLDFGLDARYRWTKNDSVTLGTAFGFVTPFQGKVTKNDAINYNDPVVGYSRVGKVGAFQTQAGISYGYGTSISSLSVDATHQLGVSYNAMHGFQNGLSLGASIGAGYTMFSSRPGQNPDDVAASYGGDDRTQWSVGIYPQAEYEFNDKLSARTVFGYFNWKHLYGDSNRYRMLQTFVYQSVGVGYSLTRDIYLYPNIQFVPDNIRSDFTNFAFAAELNIF